MSTNDDSNQYKSKFLDFKNQNKEEFDLFMAKLRTYARKKSSNVFKVFEGIEITDKAVYNEANCDLYDLVMDFNPMFMRMGVLLAEEIETRNADGDIRKM